MGKIPWRRAWLPIPSFLPGESRRVTKSRTRPKQLGMHTYGMYLYLYGIYIYISHKDIRTYNTDVSFFPRLKHGFRSRVFGPCWHIMDFPGGSGSKASAYNAGDPGWIPGWGRSPGEGNGNPFQYSCLENPMDGGAWLATVHGVAKSRTRLSDFTCF